MGVIKMPENVEARMFREMEEARKKRKPVFPTQPQK